jgi:hypothetical protein
LASIKLLEISTVELYGSHSLAAVSAAKPTSGVLEITTSMDMQAMDL